jgi:hypothetical protein
MLMADGKRPDEREMPGLAGEVLAPALDVSGVLGLDGSERASESVR